jgi:hypothetical protein
VGLVIFLAATWLLVLTTVVLEFSGIRQRGTWWRWQGTGLLLSNGAVLVDAYSRFRGWSWSWYGPVGATTGLMTVAGFVLVCIGIKKQSNGRRSTPSRATMEAAVPFVCQNKPKATDIEQ